MIIGNKIPESPGYVVTKQGVVYNSSGHDLAQCKHYKGYLYVTLPNNGKLRKMYVHRLVAQAFIPNPENKPQVNHKDGNKMNNNVENLDWVTGSENQMHSYINGFLPKAPTMRGDDHPNSRTVYIDEKRFPSITEAARSNGIPLHRLFFAIKTNKNQIDGLSLSVA